jgi:hypothetical protein
VGLTVTTFEGVIAGGVLVAAFNFLQEHMHWRRDVKARFLSERREAYTMLLRVADEYLRLNIYVNKVNARIEALAPWNDELESELSKTEVAPTLGVILKDWHPDPTLDERNNLTAVIEILQKELVDVGSERIGVLLKEMRRWPEERNADLAEVKQRASDIAALLDPLKQAFAQVELCASKKVGKAANSFRDALIVSNASDIDQIEIMNRACERFADVARNDLGVSD